MDPPPRGFCEHPLCLAEQDQYHFYCPEHITDTCASNTIIFAEPAEFDMQAIDTSFRECTEFRRRTMGEVFVQWLFDCEHCGKVCLSCARDCYEAGHYFRRVVRERNTRCGRTEVTAIVRTLKFVERSANGLKHKRMAVTHKEKK